MTSRISRRVSFCVFATLLGVAHATSTFAADPTIKVAFWNVRSGHGISALPEEIVTSDQIEQRLALTWAGVPPTAVAVQAAPVAVTLNAQNDAGGNASLATTEFETKVAASESARTIRLSRGGIP